MRRTCVAFVLCFVLALPPALSVQAQSYMQEPVDLEGIQKIKVEEFRPGPTGSQVMEIMSYLTDVYGPRLTGSPWTKEAGEWAVKKFNEWGLANAHMEPWGPFGKGWWNERFSAQVISPRAFPLIAYPKAWTPGTNGPVTSDIVYVQIASDADFAKYKGQLKGKIVMTNPLRDVRPHFEADAHRYTDAELGEIGMQPVPGTPPPPGAFNAPIPGIPPEAALRIRQEQAQLANRVSRFLVDEGAAVWLEAAPGDDGTVFVQSGGGRQATDPPTLPRVAVDSENYNRILRMIEKKVTVTAEVNIVNKFTEPGDSFNVTAEIPGTDPRKKSELVMLGAHFDSWHGGTGATDNGAGSAVMMEAIRILKTSGVHLGRTVRIGLWTGEEQGLLGSRAYVRQHFAEPAADGKSWTIKPEHSKMSVYFNVDNGTGKIRGVYLQGNEAIAPVFEQWMKPFNNLGMTQLTIRNTGGTDHLSYDAVGLPGFQFIQDPLDYDSRTHHSNMDVYERIQQADMRQMAAIVASFVYLAANRSEMMPRKPMPNVPQAGQFGGPPAPPPPPAQQPPARPPQ